MKLYAEIDSDKHGRKASKGGDGFLRVEVFRGNRKIGTLGVYEVEAGTTTPAGYRVAWHPVAGTKMPQLEHGSVMLEDTTR